MKATKAKFTLVGDDIWRLRAEVGKARRRCLLQTHFDTICLRLLDEVRVLEHGREKICDHPGSSRVWLKLELSKGVIDLFHNGAGGYRAQYYVGVENGLSANRFVIDFLMRKLLQLCARHPVRGCDPKFIAASLSDADAKVWIHQGEWIRRCPLADRNLLVRRWMNNSKRNKLRKPQLPIWAQLTPYEETKLDIMGGAVDQACLSIGVKLKSFRSSELHTIGYS